MILHVFAGGPESAKEWQKGWPPGIELLSVDVTHDPRQDLHRPATWGYLCSLAKSGRLCGIIGSPPCRTVSRLRNLRPGPPPLRNRLNKRYGLDGLDGLAFEDRTKVQGDSALLLKQLGLHVMACESGHPGVPPPGFVLESPEDPATYAQEHEAPSFWAWPEMAYFQRAYSMFMFNFDQGRLGHKQVKPTGCMTNLHELEWLNEQRCSGPQGSQLHPDLNQRVKQTASWSAWAPQFKEAIRSALMNHVLGWGEIGAGVKRLDHQAMWKQHVINGHVPFRRDCRGCLLTMASQRPHQRQKNAGGSSWSMSFDIVPLVKTLDEITNTPVRNALVATGAVPRFEPDDPGPHRTVGECPGPESSHDRPPVHEEDWGDGLEEEEFSLEPSPAEA